MTGFQEISQQLDRAEQTLREAEARLGNLAALRPVLAEIVGRAETADGNVVAEWNAQGLSALELDPRAMRLPSADLATAIRDAVREAMADMRAKTVAALQDAGVGELRRPTLEETQAQLNALHNTVVSGGRRTMEELDRAGAWRRGNGR